MQTTHSVNQPLFRVGINPPPVVDDTNFLTYQGQYFTYEGDYLTYAGIDPNLILTFDDPDTSEYILTFDDPDASEYILIMEP